MNIGANNTALSFKSVVPIKFVNTHSKDLASCIMQLEAVLNDKPTRVYNKQEKEKIIDFFEKTIPDYKKEDGVVIKAGKTFENVLFTGEDKNKIKSYIKKIMRPIRGNRNISVENKSELVHEKVAQLIDKEVRKSSQKPMLLLEIEPFKGKGRSKIKEFTLSKTNKEENFFFDGHVVTDPNFDASSLKFPPRRVINVEYEEKRLNLLS